MKWLLFLPIAFALCFPTYEPREQQANTAYSILEKKKQFAIRCTPLYVPSADEPIQPLTGWGHNDWKITTSSDSAQFYFDQGINMYYGFHIVEARASFDKATRFDPACAMAWWGKGLAFGPNINDFGYQAPSEAYPSAQKALQLSNNGMGIEQALIKALSVRYAPDSTGDQRQLNILYKKAMAAVYKNNSNNVDVASLYADAMMLLHPWDLYDAMYKPKAWTPELVQVLEHALQIKPDHPGALHYYIHSVEASANPGRALKSADILVNLMPGVAHVVHMPSHIYIRTGYYDKGITTNDKAVAAFASYLNVFPAVQENLPLYSLHNLHMKANCAQMAGNYAAAIAASKELHDEIPPPFLTFGGPVGNYIQYVYMTDLFTHLRFGKWQELLEAQVNDSLIYASTLQHFARGVAYAKVHDMVSAKKELDIVQQKIQAPELKLPMTPFSPAYSDGLVALHLLEGVLFEEKGDLNNAISSFRKAVQAEDAIVYNEPRDWLLPSRQYLGNALTKAKRYAEAIAVFKADLIVNPNNGWSLIGLQTVYATTNNTAAMAALKLRLRQAWMVSDTKITTAVF